MNPFKWLRARYRRSVTIEPDPDAPVLSLLRIDPGDGTDPQVVYLSRNNLYAMAWVCDQVHKREDKGGPCKDITLTLQIPQEAGEEDYEQKIKVPNWAWGTVGRKIIAMAWHLGWDGIECPQPAKQSAFR